MEIEDFDVYILYASQTGTSESESNLLALQLKERNIKASVSSLDDFPIEKLPEIEKCIFMISTTGQGDPCDNMKKFWNFLLIDTLPEDSLEDLTFSVFGFGDSSYQKYNSMARKLYQRLLQLGAKPLTPRALGDDSKEGGYFVDLIRWKKTLFKKFNSLNNNFPVLEDYAAGLKNAPIVDLVIETEDDGETRISDLKRVLATVDKNRLGSEVFQGELESKERVTPEDHFQDVEVMGFEMGEGVKHGYNPGDVAVVFPCNCQLKVDFMLNYFGLKGNEILKISNFKEFGEIEISSQDLFSRVLKLSETPPLFFFKLFQFYTDDEIYIEKIQEIQYNEYYEYAIKEKRDVTEILHDFPSVRIPIEIFISFIGFQRPREYSISSSLLKQKTKFVLTVAIVNYETKLKRKINGVCSKYFSELSPGQKFYYRIQKGTLNFPENLKENPVIMVGPGTGVAPFIGYLEEMEVKEKLNRHQCYLYFGNRFEEKDFLHKEFLENLRKEEKLTLKLAFSRDQAKKYYVQHAIDESNFRLSILTRSNLDKIVFLIAGNAKYMPLSVKKSIKKMLKLFLESDEKVDIQYKKMEDRKQIVFETWA